MTDFEDGLLLRFGDITEELKSANLRLASINFYLEEVVESLNLLTDWAHRKFSGRWPAYEEWVEQLQKEEK